MTEEQRKYFDLVMTAYKMSADAKAPFMTKALDWYKAYTSYVQPPKSKEPQRKARISTPHVYTAVEHTVAKMRATLFPGNTSQPIVRVLPTEESDIENAQAVETLLNWQLRKAGIRRKGEMWLRNFVIFGVAPIYTSWRLETRNIRQMKPIYWVSPLTNEPVVVGFTEPEDKQVIYYDGPDFTVDDIEDFFPDPAAFEFSQDSMRWVIRRYYKSIEWVKNQTELGFFEPRLVAQIDEKERPPLKEEQYLDVVRGRTFDTNLAFRGSEGVVELLEYIDAEKVVTVANRQVVIRAIPKPYWHAEIPCIVAVRQPMTKYPWGRGIVEPIEKTHAHLNALRNARLDNVNLVLNRMWKVLKGSVDKHQLDSEPNKVIEVLSMDDIEPIVTQDVTSSSYQEEIALRNDIEISASLPGIARGEAPPSVRSAAHAMTLLEAATERLQMDVDSFAERGLIPLGKHFLFLNQQFLTSDQVVRILGQHGMSWTRVRVDDLHREYDFAIDSQARSIPKAIEAQQKLAMISQMLPLLGGRPDLVLSLMSHVAESSGYLDLAQALREMRDMAMMPSSPMGGMSVGGGNTHPQNMPQDLDGLMKQVMNNMSVDDFTVNGRFNQG